MTIERAYNLAEELSELLGNPAIDRLLKVLHNFVYYHDATEEQLKSAVESCEEISKSYANKLDYYICSLIGACMKFGYNPLAIQDIRYFANEINKME